MSVMHDEREVDLPYEPEAEGAILGAILLDSRLILQTEKMLPEMFSFVNEQIFKTMRRAIEQGFEIDLATVTSELERGDKKIIMPATTVSALLDKAIRIDDLSMYISIVERAYNQRQLVYFTAKAERMAMSKVAPMEIVTYLQEKMSSLSVFSGDNKPQHIVDVAARVIENAEIVSGSPNEIIGLDTGIIDVNRILLGLQPKYYLFAARPSMGKSALAKDLSAGVAKMKGDRKKIILNITTEMSAEDYVMRYISSEARVDGTRILTGRLTKEEWGKIADALREISEWEIYIEDAAAMTVGDIKRKCREMIIDKGALDLVTIDQLNLMKGKADDEYKDMTEFSKGMVEIKKEFGIPVVALAQLNRKCEERKDKRPIMSDLRGSGSLEQDADVIGFLYREEMYNPSDENRGLAELNIAKQRGGARGRVELAFIPAITKFESLYITV